MNEDNLYNNYVFGISLNEYLLIEDKNHSLIKWNGCYSLADNFDIEKSTENIESIKLSINPNRSIEIPTFIIHIPVYGHHTTCQL